MVDLYYKFTSNLTFVEAILPALSTEYDFWMTNRSIHLSSGIMNYYSSLTNTPRSESYAEDVAVAAQLPAGKGCGVRCIVTYALRVTVCALLYM